VKKLQTKYKNIDNSLLKILAEVSKTLMRKKSKENNQTFLSSVLSSAHCHS